MSLTDAAVTVTVSSPYTSMRTSGHAPLPRRALLLLLQRHIQQCSLHAATCCASTHAMGRPGLTLDRVAGEAGAVLKVVTCSVTLRMTRMPVLARNLLLM